MTREERMYKGFRLQISPDEFADNPEENTDSPVFLVHFHRDLWHCFDGLPFFRLHERGCAHTGRTEDAFREWLTIYDKKEWAVYTVDSYIHGGVRLALSGSIEAARMPDRQWDVSRCGFVLIKKDGDWGDGVNFEEAAASHIKVWNQYLEGDVWTADVMDSSGETLESCGGLYGDDYAWEWAREQVDTAATQTQEVEFMLLWDDGSWNRMKETLPISVGADQWLAWARENAPWYQPPVSGHLVRVVC